MKGIKELEEIAKSLGTVSVNLIDDMVNKPEVMNALTDEQKALINQARGSYDLKGKSPEDKLAELNKLLANVSSINR